MTTKRSPRFKWLVSLLVFVVLETISLMMISESSFFQQLKISGVYMSVRGSLARAGTGIKYYFHLKDVNTDLSRENAILLAELEKYRALGINTDTLEIQYQYIPATIVANSTNSTQNFIIIDKGRRDGIEKDMGVVSPMGVAGVVSEVSERYAYVISMLNINQSISARIGREGAFGPMLWDGKSAGRALLTDIPQHIEFAVGDTIYTSGFSTIFPPQIPIGRAGKSKTVRGTHKEVEVELLQDFKTLKYVRVVKNINRDELDSLLTGNETRR
ncbi:MAG: rod shape-determining protein MreC [Bacteroidales bacterium]|jgi:rod shape-determining protein MreC|nr:rod shape-determining protein MreC [Bacteroidales bacterium]